MQKRNAEFGVGLLVILAVLAIIFLCFKVVGNRYRFLGEGSYQVVAYFANVGNLKVGAPVKVSGVLVGRVSNISLDLDNYQAKVILTISNSFVFSQDTSASILTTGILGEQYISLQEGSDTVNLKGGDTISITNSAIVMEDLLQKILVRFLEHVKN